MNAFTKLSEGFSVYWRNRSRNRQTRKIRETRSGWKSPSVGLKIAPIDALPPILFRVISDWHDRRAGVPPAGSRGIRAPGFARQDNCPTSDALPCGGAPSSLAPESMAKCPENSQKGEIRSRSCVRENAAGPFGCLEQSAALSPTQLLFPKDSSLALAVGLLLCIAATPSLVANHPNKIKDAEDERFGQAGPLAATASPPGASPSRTSTSGFSTSR